MRRLLLLGLFLGAAGCASSPAPGVGDGGASPALRVRQVPEEVGEFRQTDVHRFPTRDLGVAYRYSNGSPARIDVFVYPLTPTALAGGESPGAQARAEARSLAPSLQVQLDRGNIQSFEILADSLISIPLGQSRVDGSHLTVRVVSQNREIESHQHIFVVGDHLVKMRSTYDPGTLTESQLEEFLAMLLRAMTTVPVQTPPVAIR